jgi:hypothetical protein
MYSCKPPADQQGDEPIPKRRMRNTLRVSGRKKAPSPVWASGGPKPFGLLDLHDIRLGLHCCYSATSEIRPPAELITLVSSLNLFSPQRHWSIRQIGIAQDTAWQGSHWETWGEMEERSAVN